MLILAAGKQSNPLVTFLPLIVIVGAFYFFLIRPQRNRQKQQQAMQKAIGPGNRVLTTSGMYATVVEVTDDGVVLEIAPGVEAEFVSQAIMRVVEDDTVEHDPVDDEVAAKEDEVAAKEEAVHDAVPAADAKPGAVPPGGAKDDAAYAKIDADRETDSVGGAAQGTEAGKPSDKAPEKPSGSSDKPVGTSSEKPSEKPSA